STGTRPEGGAGAGSGTASPALSGSSSGTNPGEGAGSLLTGGGEPRGEGDDGISSARSGDSPSCGCAATGPSAASPPLAPLSEATLAKNLSAGVPGAFSSSSV